MFEGIVLEPVFEKAKKDLSFVDKFIKLFSK